MQSVPARVALSAMAAVARSPDQLIWFGTRATRLLCSLQAEVAPPAIATLPTTTTGAEQLTLRIPSYLIWGANTDVGKTVLSCGLVAASLRLGDRVAYLKPVQTGFPAESDARKVAAVGGAPDTCGPQAAQLTISRDTTAGSIDPQVLVAKTLNAWHDPVSPHLAASAEGRFVSDAEVRNELVHEINCFASTSGTSRAIAIIETAGGPATPMPSGRLQPAALQCETWRMLRIPGLLVGDGRLGGISSTISAFETLQLRGCPPVAIAIMQQAGASRGNADALQAHFGPSVPVISLPLCPPPSSSAAAGEMGVDSELGSWLESSQREVHELYNLLHAEHAARVSRLETLASATLQHVWYPFTQHQGMTEENVTVIDSRAGESFMVYQNQCDSFGHKSQSLVPKHDACSSWWTQGISEHLQPRLVKAMAQAAGRYGHVMHPETAYEPAVGLAERLLSTVGRPWASRVFYSDDGSTAIEVGLKMALRKFRADNGDVPGTRLQVVGIQNGYHGDTLGAMDAVAPSAFNGPQHMPWYKGRGLFLEPPTVGMVKGRYKVFLPQQLEEGEPSEADIASLQEVFSLGRDDSELTRRYERHIQAEMDRHERDAQAAGTPVRLGVCLLEPVLQGSGGMVFIDPPFQRAMIRVSRQRGLPVMLDEVFTGFWRLGASSAAHLLGVQPDIGCYAKLLTGGMLPLSATLASAEVFDAFLGDSKLEALLHGHSYAGNAIGCAVASEAVDILSSPVSNPNLQPGPSQHAQGDQAASDDSIEPPHLTDLWAPELVPLLSHHPQVTRVVCLGTVLAVELAAADGGGYASGQAKSFVMHLRQRGIFARPLGNVVYLMVTPTTSPAVCTGLLQELLGVLRN